MFPPCLNFTPLISECRCKCKQTPLKQAPLDLGHSDSLLAQHLTFLPNKMQPAVFLHTLLSVVAGHGVFAWCIAEGEDVGTDVGV